jgi:hypothetical protein
MTVPPYAVSFVGGSKSLSQQCTVLTSDLVSLCLAYVSDHYRIRGPILFVTGIIATAGYAIYLGASV